MDAVAVEVPASGSLAGVRGMNLGASSPSPRFPLIDEDLEFPFEDGGWSSRIFLRLCTVNFATHPSDEEDDSSAVGVIGL